MKSTNEVELIELEQVFKNSSTIYVFENAIKGYTEDSNFQSDYIYLTLYSNFRIDLSTFMCAKIEWKYGKEILEFHLQENQVVQILETIKKTISEMPNKSSSGTMTGRFGINHG